MCYDGTFGNVSICAKREVFFFFFGFFVRSLKISITASDTDGVFYGLPDQEVAYEPWKIGGSA